MATYEEMQTLVPDQAGSGFDWQALLTLLPELLPLGATPQDSYYHTEGDVLTHTRMVCESLLSLPHYSRSDNDTRFVLFYACVLHDLAKATCTVVEGSNITSAGHSKRGAIDTRILLWKAGVPFELRERICRIIAVHQVPFFALAGNRNGESPGFLAHKLSWETNLEDLLTVATADMLGRICLDAKSVLDDIWLFRELCLEHGCLNSERSYADMHTRLMYTRSGGAIPLDYPFYQEPGSQVVVLSGMPASGKDTWVREQGGSLPVISFDDTLKELGIKHGGNVGSAIHLATDRAKALLREKAPFIWNATHLSRQMRKKTLDLLYSYNAEVTLVYLECPEKLIKARNTKRDTTLTNAKIEKMLYQWEVPLATEVHTLSYRIAEK